jgi:hypothetical protein
MWICEALNYLDRKKSFALVNVCNSTILNFISCSISFLIASSVCGRLKLNGLISGGSVRFKVFFEMPSFAVCLEFALFLVLGYL